MCNESKKKYILIEANNTNENKESTKQYKIEIVWKNVIAMTILHILALNGLYLGVTGVGQWPSLAWGVFIMIFSTMGVQVGAHRLWTHRSFKAKLPLRIILAVAQTLAMQNNIYDWCRDHRVHHKYSETDADPHNSKRGFFFCHMGWLLCKKHPDVKEKGKNIDLSDLLADPVVRFQRRFYIPLLILFWAIIPMGIPMYFWEEKLFDSICGNAFRYIYTLHLTWTVNSVAHIYGTQPYDKKVNARDSAPVIYWGMGEGYHNYHHVFPYDYSASEFGWKDNWNPATAFIDFFAWIGWAYDRKVVRRDIVEQRMGRTGDKDKKYTRFAFWIDFLIGLTATSYIFLILLVFRLVFAA